VEACDDANALNTDACLNDCTAARCGDGYVRSGVEDCDDANALNTDACLSDCTAAACGDGYTWSGSEVCDDGDTVTELCGGGADCLSDCSLLEETCGNGSADPGEACDDGDADSMDACTTSCTANNHNIGAPCTCTGSGCSDTDFTAGTINGCSGVTIPPGSGGELACLRSIHESTSGYDTYYAEGYCTIMAVTCSGGGLCIFVPQPGDFDTFACPAGTYEYLDERIVMGMTITSKTCLEICDSDADCRWNAYDTFRSACGQYACLPAPDDPTISVCDDARMLAP
jgi:cysteine-rich repeat protein